MFGWFRRKPEPPADRREWKDNWERGDIAQCVSDNWSADVPPWERPKIGQRCIVVGFSEGESSDGAVVCYFLHFAEFPGVGYWVQSFRKVRPVSAEKSEVVERILNAKPGADRMREDVK